MRISGGANDASPKARNRRTTLLLAFVVALTLTVARQPASGVPSAPPNDTFEITITSATVVAPGGTISFDGTCWSSALNAAQEALVTGYLVAGPGITEPFTFWVTVPVSQTAGAFSGTIAVPGNAPNGAYGLSVACSTQDQALGRGETPFSVDGPQITTTTSSVPLRAESHVDPAQEAIPVRGTAALTG